MHSRMKLRTLWFYRRRPFTLPPALLLAVCSACSPHRARSAESMRQCGGGEHVFHDPVVAVVRDSVTAGGPAAVAQFYWTALARPVSSGTWGTDDRSVVGTVDSLGRARVTVPQAGRYSLRARILGSVSRLDSLAIPQHSTVWVRIGLARGTIGFVCVTATSADQRSLQSTTRNDTTGVPGSTRLATSR